MATSIKKDKSSPKKKVILPKKTGLKKKSIEKNKESKEPLESKEVSKQKKSSKSPKSKDPTKSTPTKSPKPTIIKPISTPIPDDKKHSLELKSLVSPTVYNCLSKLYNSGTQYGYVILVGGEAINHYLLPNDHISTDDFDLKFVINPEISRDETELIRANAIRMRIVISLYDCLKGIQAPKGYRYIYPKLGIIQTNQRQEPIFKLIYIEDNKMFFVEPTTGEEKFDFYKSAKTFKIVMYYRLDGEADDVPPHQFDLVDLSMSYPKDIGYSFFETEIYDTFLKPPFNEKVSIPFITKTYNQNQIRFPTLPYLIFDNYRMILISLDIISGNKDNEEIRAKWESKLDRYKIKVEKMLQAQRQRNPQEEKLITELKQTMDDAHSQYENLSSKNIICFREGSKFVKEKLDKPECDADYDKKLNHFRQTYEHVSELVSKLK